MTRRRRLAWTRLKTSVGGLVFGRWMRFGRGGGWSRKRGSRCVADRGRPVYVCERTRELAGSQHYVGVYSETWCSLLVVVENVQGLYDAVHGGVC